jgi:hypothetical protein
LTTGVEQLVRIWGPPSPATPVSNGINSRDQQKVETNWTQGLNY